MMQNMEKMKNNFVKMRKLLIILISVRELSNKEAKFSLDQSTNM